MKITYGTAKDTANLAKHEISLVEAYHIEWDTLWAKPDLRRYYGEDRMIGYALIATRLYCVVFTDREGERRIISLRKANNREKIRYATNRDD